MEKDYNSRGCLIVLNDFCVGESICGICGICGICDGDFSVNARPRRVETFQIYLNSIKRVCFSKRYNNGLYFN